MPELILDYPEIDISENWAGFLLNHLTKEEHPNHNKPHNQPDEVDWKRNIIPGVLLESKLVDYKFLWAGKKFYLKQNVESPDLEPLPEPIEIVQIHYDYGQFNGLEAEYQDTIFNGWYKATPDSKPELIPYKTLRNNLSNTGDRDKLARWRINTAIAYIQQTAKEIDLKTQELFDTYGESTALSWGLQNLNLTQGIIDFYRFFPAEMSLYKDTGSLEICDRIDEIMAEPNPANLAWLKENIIVGQEDNQLTLKMAGTSIKENFTNAVTPVTADEIAEAVR